MLFWLQAVRFLGSGCATQADVDSTCVIRIHMTALLKGLYQPYRQMQLLLQLCKNSDAEKLLFCSQAVRSLGSGCATQADVDNKLSDMHFPALPANMDIIFQDVQSLPPVLWMLIQQRC